MRTAFDLSPVYGSMIGADHLAALLDGALRDKARDYPPYDIEKTGDQSYRITLGTAGFRRDELEITAQPNLLVVSGRKGAPEHPLTYLHCGVPHRSFEQRFDLADHVVVRSARYEDGLLTIDLERELPESLRPRRIEIDGPSGLGLSGLLGRRPRRAARAA